KGSDIELVESFSIGTVDHNHTFFVDGRINDAAFEAAIVSARGVFEDAAQGYRAQRWAQAYGSSGTIRAIGEAIEKNGMEQGMFSLAGMQSLKQRLIGYGDTDRITLEGLKPDRANVIAGGLA